MAFGKISKQDLIDAGLDPDKIKEYQEKGVTKDDITALKTELATSVTDLIKAQFTELETKLKPQTVKVEDNIDPNKTKTPEELEMERQNEFLTNPTAYVDKRVGSLGMQAAVEFKKLSRDLAYKDASREMRGFKNSTLKTEIDEEWKKYTPEVMARNNADPSTLIQQVHDMVMGRHQEEIIQDRDKKDGKYSFVQSGGGGGTGSVGGGGGGSSDKTEVLSEAEKALAKKFGMTEDEWKQQGVDMEKEENERHARLAGV